MQQVFRLWSLPRAVNHWLRLEPNSFRENEAEIYARIRSLQSHDYYNLPPQNNPREYEGLVRDHLDQALNVPHYRNILDMEYFELTVLERRGLLQDRLFNLMLGEQNLSRIMELSPYTNIRREAYDFLDGKVEPVGSLQHSLVLRSIGSKTQHYRSNLHSLAPFHLIESLNSVI
ncbi:hypothetical protein Tco_1118360 [Tanacetum coccineum]